MKKISVIWLITMLMLVAVSGIGCDSGSKLGKAELKY